MQSTNRTSWTVVAIVAIIALIAVTACQSPAPTAQTGPVHVVVDNAGDFGGGGGPAGAAGDTNFTNLVASGDVTVGDDLAVTGDTTLTGGLTVTGGVTGTNVLTTGNQTVGGVKTFTSAVTGTGGATITGAAVNLNASSNFATNINTGTTNAALTLGGGSGTVAVNSSDWDISTAGVMTGIGAITADGAISGLKPIVVKDASYSVTTADTAAVIKASGAITLTLPAAAVGLHYCIVNFTGDDQTIDFADAADVALNEVNAPGDRVTNTTVYDNICLTAIDATNWVTLSSVGTWSDGN